MLAKEVTTIATRRKAISKIEVKQSLQSLSTRTKTISNFKQAYVEFLKNCRIKGLSPHTITFYDKELLQTMRSLAEIEAPINDIRKINTTHIEKFIEHQQSLGRAINTINTRLRAGLTFFAFCLRKKYVSKNPYEGIQQLKKRHEVGATFNKRQLVFLFLLELNF
ncbi:site-specific recombinase XerD [Cytobacillus horneckiae]|uniref:site-specific integrase n=1 Tax=Cytobacillus horneckiae TaxID=549687 RepID=UPI0008253E9D|nr:site-specific integrase [Cytobacillus horneckiae]MBN6885359.1 site-specific integrase [Cytobacillus horneckiae]MEC1154128.1 site-specific integrase [Cytobacillus horneckiae]MED2936327.1 site-specific integrase [Cytobacillus horneckiae]